MPVSSLKDCATRSKKRHTKRVKVKHFNATIGRTVQQGNRAATVYSIGVLEWPEGYEETWRESFRWVLYQKEKYAGGGAAAAAADL